MIINVGKNYAYVFVALVFVCCVDEVLPMSLLFGCLFVCWCGGFNVNCTKMVALTFGRICENWFIISCSPTYISNN